MRLLHKHKHWSYRVLDCSPSGMTPSITLSHHTAGQQETLRAAGHSGKYLQQWWLRTLCLSISGSIHKRHWRPCYMCTVTVLYHTSAGRLVLYHTTTYSRSCQGCSSGNNKLTHRQVWYEWLLSITRIFSRRTNNSRLEVIQCWNTVTTINLQGAKATEQKHNKWNLVYS